VKVFGCRPPDGRARRAGAGVRKPPREETAGMGTWAVRRALWGFGRSADGGWWPAVRWSKLADGAASAEW